MRATAAEAAAEAAAIVVLPAGTRRDIAERARLDRGNGGGAGAGGGELRLVVPLPRAPEPGGAA